MNRLYTLEGYDKNKTVGNPFFAAFFKMPKISMPVFKQPVLPQIPRIQPPQIPVIKPVSIPPVKIAAPKIQNAIIPKIPALKIAAPKIQNAIIPKIQAPKFPSAKIPKNPFGKPRKDQSSSYDDFQNEIDSQREINYSPEVNYPKDESFTQSDIQAETNQTPVYGYDYNDVMVGAIKINVNKLMKPTKKLLNPLGLKVGLGKKKPTILQKLTLKPAKQKIIKVTPQEAKKALAVTGAVAGTIATGGALGAPLAGGIAGLLGTTAAVVGEYSATVAAGSVLGSTLIASGEQGGINGLLNATGALLNNPTIQNNVPLAQSANTAINTGLNYYNTGAGIAESLGLSAPSLGTTSEEFFSLLSNQERGLQNLPEDITPQPSPLNPFKNPLTDPTSPLYVPPVGQKPSGGQTGQNQIVTTDKNKTQNKTDSSSLILIAGIGFLGYLFINRKGKK